MQRAGIRNYLTRSIHRLAHRPCAIGGTMSNPERFPGSREEDAWLSDEQLERCAPAETEPFQGPVPTRMISNGEYMPHPQTEKQQHVEARVKELADRAAKKLGIS